MKQSNKENIEQDGITSNNTDSKPSPLEVEFIIASCKCDFRALNVILAKNPDLVNMKNPISNGYTALHFACKFGVVEVIRGLVGNFGANVNVISHNGSTPLHVAVQFKQEEAVRLLMSQYSANKSIRDYSGRLPADLITSDGMESIMKMVGPATARTCVKPVRESLPHNTRRLSVVTTVTSLKKGFQSISAGINSDGSTKGFFSFRKGSETPSSYSHHQNHLAPNNQLRDMGHSLPHLLHAPDMTANIKKSLSSLTNRSPAKHKSPVRAILLGQDDETQ